MESGGGVLFTLCEENPLGSFGSIVPGNLLRRLCRKLGSEPRAGYGIINYSTNTVRKAVTWIVAQALEMTVTCHPSYAMAQESQEELQTAVCGVWGTEPY